MIISPTVRHYVYKKYNLSFTFEKNKVVGVVLFSPDDFYKNEKVETRDRKCYDAYGNPT